MFKKDGRFQGGFYVACPICPMCTIRVLFPTIVCERPKSLTYNRTPAIILGIMIIEVNQERYSVQCIVYSVQCIVYSV